jgi:hypothetical protein
MTRTPRLILAAALVAICAGLLTACDPPPTDGFYSTKPPGAALPSGAVCADQVRDRGNLWEPRPQNEDEANNAPNVDGIDGYDGMTHQAETWGRVRGNFVGTTDQTIQWAACKWGLADNLIRAEAIVESTWDMDQLGDAGDCGDGVPASVGIMQIKWCQHPGTRAYAQHSLSFNLDYYGAVIRGCYNGWDYVTSQPGQLWGCVDRWFSGGLNPNSNYVDAVQNELAAKRWRGWEG